MTWWDDVSGVGWVRPRPNPAWPRRVGRSVGGGGGAGVRSAARLSGGEERSGGAVARTSSPVCPPEGGKAARRVGPGSSAAAAAPSRTARRGSPCRLPQQQRLCPGFGLRRGRRCPGGRRRGRPGAEPQPRRGWLGGAAAAAKPPPARGGKPRVCEATAASRGPKGAPVRAVRGRAAAPPGRRHLRCDRPVFTSTRRGRTDGSGGTL